MTLIVSKTYIAWDFVDDFRGGPIEPLSESNESGPIEPLEKINSINELKAYILGLSGEKYNKITANSPTFVERQQRSIQDIYKKFEQFQQLMKDEDDLAILDGEIKIIESSLGSLVGYSQADDVLNYIFSNFCIGK